MHVILLFIKEAFKSFKTAQSCRLHHYTRDTGYYTKQQQYPRFPGPFHCIVYSLHSYPVKA